MRLYTLSLWIRRPSGIVDERDQSIMRGQNFGAVHLAVCESLVYSCNRTITRLRDLNMVESTYTNSSVFAVFRCDHV